MSELIRISAKNLGEVALPGFCPRCFWIKLKLGNRLPYQTFPGVFSTIDSYNKRLVHRWFDKYRRPPDWLAPLGPLIGYREPPHHSKFYIVDREYQVQLTGSPDAIFIRPDDSHLIVDYKTARYTGNQDKLYPMYEVQLNVYAVLAEQHGLSPVSGLALLYMEPASGDAAAESADNHRPDGFVLGFVANAHPVTLDLDSVRPLLARTRELYDRFGPPRGRPGCKNCGLLNGLLDVVQR